MTVLAEPGTGLVEPLHFWMPERAGSHGRTVADVAKLAGRPLDPEQLHDVDAMTSVDERGRWAALEVAIVECRQNGKTLAVIEPIVLTDLFLGPPDQITWTAHLFKTARKAFEDIKAIIDGTPEFRRRVRKISEANGDEAVWLHNGASLEFLARSKGGGRGLGGKRIVFDEALYLGASTLGAVIPTASARPNPQIMYASSAGVAESVHLRSIRGRGRRGGDPSLVYIERGAPEGGCKLGKDCPHTVGTPGCKADDETLWPLANHAMVRGRITIEFVRAERRALPAGEFVRERLGWWDDPLSGENPIDASAWALLAKPRKRRPAGVVFFVDVAEHMRSAAIGAAYGVRGKPHAEIVDHRLGGGWVVKRCLQLAKRYPDAPWAGLAGGAVGALAPDLSENDIELESLTSQDMGRGFTHVQKLIAGKGLTHSGDEAVTSAIEGAVKRDVGDGLWVAERRKSTADITPLNAEVGALWALELYGDYDPSKALG